MTRILQETSVLVVMALREEAATLFERVSATTVFTGVGKVNATYALTRALANLESAGRRPSLVVNFGTAGSERFASGALVECCRFMQVDMDARALGFELGRTPFDDAPVVIEFPRVFSQLPEAICSSADRFDVGRTGEHPREIVEMEAFALAKVCKRESLPFACVKYVSDGADHAAAQDWHSSLPIAAQRFRELYDQLTGK